MKLLITDLDDTLIYTTEFKNQLFQDLSILGKVSLSVIQAVYQDNQPRRFDGDWLDVIINSFAERLKVPKEQVAKTFNFNLSHIRTIPQSVELVRNFDGKKVLLSLGNKDFQYIKIHAAKLIDLFNAIIITPVSQDQYLKPLIKDKAVMLGKEKFNEVTYLDDRSDTIAIIQKDYPWIKIIDVKQLS